MEKHFVADTWTLSAIAGFTATTLNNTGQISRELRLFLRIHHMPDLVNMFRGLFSFDQCSIPELIIQACKLSSLYTSTDI